MVSYPCAFSPSPSSLLSFLPFFSLAPFLHRCECTCSKALWFVKGGRDSKALAGVLAQDPLGNIAGLENRRQLPFMHQSCESYLQTSLQKVKLALIAIEASRTIDSDSAGQVVLLERRGEARSKLQALNLIRYEDYCFPLLTLFVSPAAFCVPFEGRSG